ncbi:uncharacterized protein OCT59_025097 [Rhizophagus irregularis]|uniref:Uncharacterized protein n=2 Tax=Rhizophagus irregularis TaxID=588596 RepID=A0A015MK00_RHIIW|nr:hypothetical protein RirG_117090 [Rhizophagus irregularis DAOM 197198w]UZO04726.1 hypothetical protein OCT59_025097 [Rhizophagus irregularis]GBC11960.1 hypothetical protein RIR_jg34816.t1 [Rhizophagus irregularis DAOM 181602=DAOM 197198]CAG8690133.1 19275_t:CDS:1 [Rhizophagus irregularis]
MDSMESQRLSYERVNSRLFFQNKENFDPVNKTFAGTRHNNNFNRRTNPKFMNYVVQRRYRDPLAEIFMNTYQQEDSFIMIDTEAVAVEITSTREKKRKKTRTIKPATKPKTESLLKLR